MRKSITTLLVFQLIGESISYISRAPIPGPVFGMLLLFLFLLWRPAVASELRATAQELLRHLSLLFIPAGVGIMVYAARIRDEWLPITAALLVSSALTLIVTGATVRWFARRSRRSGPPTVAPSESPSNSSPH